MVYVGISTSIANIDRYSIIPTSSDKAAIHLCHVVHNSFQQYILKPTSGTNTSTIFLDLLLTNHPSANNSIDTIDSRPGCDHGALNFSLCLSIPRQPRNNCVLFNSKAPLFQDLMVAGSRHFLLISQIFFSYFYAISLKFPNSHSYFSFISHVFLTFPQFLTYFLLLLLISQLHISHYFLT